MIKVDESLSMAFLVRLERLTPVERAVFLLRKVFEYEYSEIAAVLGQSEVNCRQILSRARRHVNEMRPRIRASHEQQSNLLERFLMAIRCADMDGLLALLSQDVVLYSDGGGEGPAVPNQIHGADRVARGILLGFAKFVPRNLSNHLTQVNRNPGVLSYLDGRPFSVITLDGSDQISAVYVISNPDKLAYIPGFAVRTPEAIGVQETRPRIRRATAADARSITVLLNRAFLEFEPLYTPEAFVATVLPESGILKRMEEGPLWVAENAHEEIIGTVSAMRAADSAFVRGMAVDPEARGQKLGQKLLKLTEDYAREQGFDRMSLFTTPFLLEAIRLYQSYGFGFTGEKVYPHGTELLRMIKVLDNTVRGT